MHSGFWQNEHVFSYFTVFVTVSKGNAWVYACIELLAALVLQFEILRALKIIILEVEGAMEKVWFMSSLPGNECLDPIFEKNDLIEGCKIIWFVINNLLVSFEMSGGSYNLHKILSWKP